jgi:hypothetical protein
VTRFLFHYSPLDLKSRDEILLWGEGCNTPGVTRTKTWAWHHIHCWGEGKDATLRSRPSSLHCTNGGKMTDAAHPSPSLLQDEGLQRSLSIPRPHPTWRPTWDLTHCNRPCMEKRVTGLICNSFSVMTVCNPPSWEYSGDSLCAQGHKRPYIGTLDTRAPINTPVQCP